jgi:hypothetical protein
MILIGLLPLERWLKDWPSSILQQLMADWHALEESIATEMQWMQFKSVGFAVLARAGCEFTCLCSCFEPEKTRK